MQAQKTAELIKQMVNSLYILIFHFNIPQNQNLDSITFLIVFFVDIISIYF